MMVDISKIKSHIPNQIISDQEPKGAAFKSAVLFLCPDIGLFILEVNLMTSDEKYNIDRLQQQGIGYRKIADVLGISQNTVKSYLKRNTKTTSSKEVSGVCKQCGISIEQIPHKRKKAFCSGSCRSRWWRENMGLS